MSAALLISRLQAGSRQHPLAKAMLEYGKLLRTLHALRWFTDEAFRRRIGRQLNRGEALNDLRFIFFANRGTPTTKTRRPRRTATRSSSTRASSRPPATSKTPSTLNEPTGTPSAAHGGELVGELVNYENSYWLCYVAQCSGRCHEPQCSRRRSAENRRSRHTIPRPTLRPGGPQVSLSRPVEN